jgi:hypothetical protein
MFLAAWLLVPRYGIAQSDSLLALLEAPGRESYAIFCLPGAGNEQRSIRLIPPIFEKRHRTVFKSDIALLQDTLLKIEAIPAYTSYCIDSIPTEQLDGKTYCIYDTVEHALRSMDSPKKLCLKAHKWEAQYHFISPIVFKSFESDSITLVEYRLVSDGRVVDGRSEDANRLDGTVHQLPDGVWMKCILTKNLLLGLPSGGRQVVRQLEQRLNFHGYEVAVNGILEEEDRDAMLKLQQRHPDWPIGSLNRCIMSFLGLLDIGCSCQGFCPAVNSPLTTKH